MNTNVHEFPQASQTSTETKIVKNNCNLGFHHNVDGICGLLYYYTASYDNCLPTFRDNVSVPSSFLLGLLTREDGNDTFSRKVGKQLPHDAV
jgi:hypothetical protein